MGTHESYTLTCRACGFKNVIHVTVSGDWDGPDSYKCGPEKCQFCNHAKKLKMKLPDVVLIVDDKNYEGIHGICNVCGHPVASYLCNASVVQRRPEADQWDWWLSCGNPECEHHYGCGYFQDGPAWVVPIRS